MIDDWDIPPTRAPETGGPQVAAVIPLPAEMGGSGEIMVMSAFGSMKLPAGEILPRETSLRAVTRVILGTTGATVSAERLVYVVEQPGRPILLCVLCALVPDDAADERAGVRFANLASAEGEFEPSHLRELLAEDVRAGFVRGVAHIAVGFDEAGREQATITW